ncbi:MAG TPA: MarR family transcriptional regulator [Edaphobacter sp.]|nr:MarR family transcriptional regulator [Edaphobacter sp.]
MRQEKTKGSGRLAFLLAQVGGHAASQFAARLTVLQLTPPDAGILRLLGMGAGISQQELSAKLGIHPSRLVAILDALEHRGFVQRKPNPADRRQYALHLTPSGKKILDEIGVLGRQHGEALCASLSPRERETLTDLLLKIAAEQGLTPGVHPGYRQMKSPK